MTPLGGYFKWFVIISTELYTVLFIPLPLMMLWT